MVQKNSYSVFRAANALILLFFITVLSFTVCSAPPSEGQSYTVEYNANGGSGVMGNSDFTIGVSQALRENAFTLEGYAFAGWATSDTGARVYTDQQSVINLTTVPGATVTLYAVWGIPVYLTLNPEGEGYFEYMGKKYYESVIGVPVIDGEYLYYYETPDKAIIGVQSGWELIPYDSARSEQPINSNMSVTRSQVVSGTADYITLTFIDPGVLKMLGGWLGGQGYYVYRGVEYYVSTTVRVPAGEYLYYNIGVGGAIKLDSRWMFYSFGDIAVSGSPIYSDWSIVGMPGTEFNNGITVGFPSMPPPKIILALDAEEQGYFTYRDIVNSADPFEEVAGLYIYYYETSGKEITSVKEGWKLVSDKAARSMQPFTENISLSRSDVVNTTDPP